jgi:tetratricopeptide (TPR) repeat protein
LSVWSVFFASKPLTLGEFVSRYSVLKRRINDVDWTVTEEATQTRQTVQEDGEATRAELAAMEARLFEAFQAGSNRPLGADEARSIKEAVAQIFASKEARKRPVQEALSKRRFDEAASQLEGLARQSEAAKDDFAGDAAESYREAGALWLGRNTGRAIENFEKARENDPNHFWTHIELARLYELAGRTADAHLLADDAIRQAASDRDRSVALDALADALAAQGRSGDALTAYEEGLGIRRALAGGDADNAGARRDVSVSLNKVGDMLAAQGRSGDALTAYEEGLGIRRALAGGDADNAGARRDVIVSLAKIATLKGGADGAALWREAHERACAMDRDGVLRTPDQWIIEKTGRMAEGEAE